jgi:hypothetical protein
VWVVVWACPVWVAGTVRAVVGASTVGVGVGLVWVQAGTVRAAVRAGTVWVQAGAVGAAVGASTVGAQAGTVWAALGASTVRAPVWAAARAAVRDAAGATTEIARTAGTLSSLAAA